MARVVDPVVSTRPQVVVIGAGFGGLATAKELAGSDVDVTVVDQHNFHTFQPLLYQVATAGLNAADVAYAVRGIFQRQSNVRFRQATATGVDWERRRLAATSPDGAALSLPFDHLVIGAGATANFFGIEGAAEHAHPLYSLTDAIELRNHVLGRFEAADAQPSLIDDGALTFVIVGGGPTGVEVAGALAELFGAVLRRDFPALDIGKARVLLVEMADHVLTPFSAPSQRHALETLASRGVEVRLSEAVVKVDDTRVTLRSGEVLAAHTLVWAAGVKANPLAAVLGVETGRGGRIVVDPDLSIPGREGAYAIGDVALIDDPRDGVLPQLAQVAIQSGKHAARQIDARLAGREPTFFRYRDKGTMATIGRRAAVAELPIGLRLKGTPAWAAWLGLHLVYLMGFRNRLSVMLNWAWNYFTWDRGPRLIVPTSESRPTDR